MVPRGLGDEFLPLDRISWAELAAPWTGIRNPSSELGASVTWSVAPFLENSSDANTWTVSIVSGMDAIYEKTDANAVTRYVYANGMRIARIECTGNPPTCTTSYYLGDHLGSTRKVLDANRVEQYAVEYEPFGKPYSTSGSQPDKYKYTMEKHDDPTGLVYLRARQYDPEIGSMRGSPESESPPFTGNCRPP